MRKTFLLITTLLLSFGIWLFINSTNSSAESTSIQNRLAAVKKYKYYLDKGNDKIGKEMTKKDLVIVEPIEMQQKYIKQAQKNGTLIYGYINAMEADKWNLEFYNQLKEEDFYKDERGEKMYFSEWDSYLMDMTSEHYQALLLEEIQKQIVQRGLDGVFLDTVGNIESYLPEKEQGVQNEAMLAFIKNIKQQYNDLSVAQNWGFQTLADYTAPYIDFVMWENFSYDVVEKDEWALNRMQQLVKIREKFGTQVMTIGFNDEKKSRALAEKHHFKFFYSPAGSYYNTWQ
ncbi:endo alpha-1,4 polygalactosaminidase [Lysinibacillus xylanilyticus]|uniref:endo alpha-1,4 polygalactosaminidase n=1 Tax=Lysinibacillus xylanilyticus TaxID=582475 RepID=UPI002B249796|nr:endo alpha-1,4 polygalactosaminidase [Lysinibacillus xylanilyticus]MEB2300177.1 endo alpha-1,4 polygalactosaminidase [Lysinibacillus xylanilyticus]